LRGAGGSWEEVVEVNGKWWELVGGYLMVERWTVVKFREVMEEAGKIDDGWSNLTQIGIAFKRL